MIVGLFRILLFILLFYLIIKLIRYFLSPGPSKQAHSSSGSRTARNEGEVTIDHIPDKKKKVDQDSGEYVDFEEMDSDERNKK